MKKIISFAVVLCLLFSLAAPAFAADVYSISESITPLQSNLLKSTNSGVSVAAVEPSDLDYYLEYNGLSVAYYLQSLVYNLSNSSTGSGNTTVRTLLEQMYTALNYIDGYLRSSGSYLDGTGQSSNFGSSHSIADLVRAGFLGLSANVNAVTDAINDIPSGTDYTSILNMIENAVDGLESGLSTVNTSIGTVNTSVGGVKTAVDNVRTAVNSAITALGTLNTSVNGTTTAVNTVNTTLTTIASRLISSAGPLLASNGVVGTVSNPVNILNVSQHGFAGLATLMGYTNARLSASAGQDFTNSIGQLSQLSGDSSLTSITRIGFNAIRALVAGSESDNIYTSTLYDNNNTTKSANSTGLGPLLNTQLNSLGANLGKLAFVFASDDDIKLKEDSKPIMDEVNNIYDDSSDSKVKVSASGIGSVKGFAGSIAELFDTGADIGDIVTIATNANSFRWFTAETAADIDSIDTSSKRSNTLTISDEESTYDRLHREFNEIYFPDRVGGGN